MPENQLPAPVTIDVDVCRTFVVGDGHSLASRPRPDCILWILVPNGRRAGKADDDQVVPFVAIYIVHEVGERIAVAQWVVLEGGTAHRVHLPGGRLIPDVASGDVGRAVVVEVADGSPLAAKLRIELRL